MRATRTRNFVVVMGWGLGIRDVRIAHARPGARRTNRVYTWPVSGLTSGQTVLSDTTRVVTPSHDCRHVRIAATQWLRANITGRGLRLDSITVAGAAPDSERIAIVTGFPFIRKTPFRIHLVCRGRR
jgi:hypothetical protein